MAAEEGELAIQCHSSEALGTPPNILRDTLQARYRDSGLVCEYRWLPHAADLPRKSPTLTLMRFGLLLDQQRYYLAASEQLARFEKGVESLGPRIEESGELATVARLQRGPTAVRLARAYSFLGDYAGAADAWVLRWAKRPRTWIFAPRYSMRPGTTVRVVKS
jgi:hypothetical protein